MTKKIDTGGSMARAVEDGAAQALMYALLPREGGVHLSCPDHPGDAMHTSTPLGGGVIRRDYSCQHRPQAGGWFVPRPCQWRASKTVLETVDVDRRLIVVSELLTK